jgi:uncharacterized peroxidase-related enzyme
VAFIRTTGIEEAEGALQREYEAAIRRAGKVFNIVGALSLRPAALQRTIALYQTIMFGPSGLSRAQREMLAVVTSQVNECHY